MKPKSPYYLTLAATAVWVFVYGIIVSLFVTITASLSSCDNPQTIAWSCYYCAEDTLKAGDPYAALDFMAGVKKGVDSELDRMADSLSVVIERAIEEDKAQAKDNNE